MKTENIYISVPSDALLNTDETPEYRKPILEFLKERTGQFFTAKEIATICKFPTRGTQVEVRKAITLLLEIDKEPIMSMAKGFGYVTNTHQMNFYAEQLEERLKGLQRRIRSVREIANNMKDDNNG